MHKLIILTALFLTQCFYTINTFAQWQPEIMLSADTTGTYASHDRSIASDGNYVHAVWYEWRIFNSDNMIVYNRSTNNGLTWGTPLRLSPVNEASLYPSITANGSYVHITWSGFRNGNYEIFYRRSSDYGATWQPVMRLTNNTFVSFHPSIAAVNNNIFIVWEDNRDGDNEIYFLRSTSHGSIWLSESRLTTAAGSSYNSSIALDAANIYIAWSDERESGTEVFFKRSSNYGVSWGSDAKLTNEVQSAINPYVAASNGNIYLVYDSYVNNDFRLFFMKSSNSGGSWTPKLQFVGDSVRSCAGNIIAADTTVHMVFQTNLGNAVYSISINKGSNWSNPLMIAAVYSLYPSVSVAGNTVHVAWEDVRSGNREVYYKRNPTGHPVNVHTVSGEVPRRFSLLQNYPNPFNPVTKIKFDIPKAEFVNISVFDVLGRKTTSLVNEKLNAGTFETDWDASQYPSGVYYYKITAGDFTETKKMILIK